MDKTKQNSQQRWLFFLILIAGLVARLELATLGHNYDMASYRIVVGILDHGGNVYAGTERYNYGPVWFQILHALDFLARHNETAFRYLLAGLLSLVDAGICILLWRRFGYLAACLFFLNPVSIIITGFHNQFDNLALLLGFWSVLLVGDDFEKPVGRRKFAGLAVLGLSLMTKHLLFAFPFWLAVKQKGLFQKCVVLLVPVAIFLLGFAPYWPGGRAGIIQHVFSYKSSATEYFYNYFVPTAVQFVFSAQAVWLLVLGVFAFINRRKPALESLLLYTCVLVATAPATTNQYFAIPSAFTSVFVNFFTVAYTIVATFHVAVDVNGPHLLKSLLDRADDFAICVLCLALVWVDLA